MLELHRLAAGAEDASARGMEPVSCPVCDSSIIPARPPWSRLVNVTLWIFALVLALAASLPLIGLAVLPLWFLALWGVGVSAARMSIVLCPVCHSEVARPATEPPPAVRGGPLVPHPA
jgi:hypothetical protein